MAKLDIKTVNVFTNPPPAAPPMRSNDLFVNGKWYGNYLNVILLSKNAWVGTDRNTRQESLYVCGRPLSVFESIKQLAFYDENKWIVRGAVSGLAEQRVEIFKTYDSLLSKHDGEVEASLMVDNNNFFWINKKDGLVRVCIEGIYFGVYHEVRWTGRSLFVQEINSWKKLPLHIKTWKDDLRYIMRIH